MTPLLAYAKAYRRQTGIEASDSLIEEQLARRAAWIPWYARLGAQAAAVAVRWFMPALRLGAFKRFDDLTPSQADALLLSLQNTHSPILRGGFVTLKLLVLPACYAQESRLAGIGYDAGKGS